MVKKAIVKLEVTFECAKSTSPMVIEEFAKYLRDMAECASVTVESSNTNVETFTEEELDDK